mgnify:CR=1 FL=1
MIQGSVNGEVLSVRRVVVVIPTYNEVGNIATVIAGVMSALPDASILVVDDNSPDGTADCVDEIAAGLPEGFPGFVKAHRRLRKSGLGAAYRDGFAVAFELGATICVQMDADLSHHPMYLPAIVSAVDERRIAQEEHRAGSPHWKPRRLSAYGREVHRCTSSLQDA